VFLQVHNLIASIYTNYTISKNIWETEYKTLKPSYSQNILCILRNEIKHVNFILHCVTAIHFSFPPLTSQVSSCYIWCSGSWQILLLNCQSFHDLHSVEGESKMTPLISCYWNSPHILVLLCLKIIWFHILTFIKLYKKIYSCNVF
jgi:hypothetical protein